jgi:hypothetical protein
MALEDGEVVVEALEELHFLPGILDGSFDARERGRPSSPETVEAAGGFRTRRASKMKVPRHEPHDPWSRLVALRSTSSPRADSTEDDRE